MLRNIYLFVGIQITVPISDQSYHSPRKQPYNIWVINFTPHKENPRCVMKILKASCGILLMSH